MNCGQVVGTATLAGYNPSMRKSWNKDLTKETHASLMKTSQTMRRKKIDNFKRWRDEMKRNGEIKSNYNEFRKNGDLAELIGVVLGDGNITLFPRTEALRIVYSANNQGFIKRYASIVEKVFGKKPALSKRKTNAVNITLYEKHISKRLQVPSGSKGTANHPLTIWIGKSKENIKRYLRGLFEAEGCFCVHKPTSTYKFIFNNRNESLLKNVYRLLVLLGFHPNRSGYKVQISRKVEVYNAIEMLRFRHYE
jgi:hypothetical protein